MPTVRLATTCSAGNVAYYRHHGFEVRSEWDLRTEFDQGPHMWGMLRPLA